MTISRTRRTVLALTIEKTSGTLMTAGTAPYSDGTRLADNGRLPQIPVVENFNITELNAEDLKINRAKPTLDPDGFAITNPTWNFRGSLYWQGSGIKNVPPAWCAIWRVSGFAQARFTNTASTGPSVATDDAPVPDDDTWAGDVGTGIATTSGKKFNYKFALVTSNAETKLSTAVVQTNDATATSAITITFPETTGSPASAVWDGKTVRIYRSKQYTSTLGDDSSDANYYCVGQKTLGADADNSAGAHTFVDILPDSQLVEAVADEAGGADYTKWTPISQDHEGATVFNWLDAIKAPASGVRGNITFTADAGQPFLGEFTLQGGYNTVVAVANPALLAANPGIPPRLCNIALGIFPSGGSPRTPVVKSLSFTPGTAVDRRDDANVANCVIEYLILGEFDPRITVQIEVDTTDWMQEYLDGKFYAIAADIGAGTAGQNIRIVTDPAALGATTALSSATTFSAQQASAPRFTDVRGIRCYELTFVLTGTNNNFCALFLH